LAVNKPSAKALLVAAKHNETGLKHYAAWEIEMAINAFQKASDADPTNPEYHLNLARAHARNGSYPAAMRSLGEYLHNETDEHLTGRYERLFSSALDDVERQLIDGMRPLGMPVQLIGKAIQMWLEYRLTIGRQPLAIPQPEQWSAALCFAVCKINFVKINQTELANQYGIDVPTMKDKYALLVETLDLIPADYRYFIGDENPLDKIFEAAQKMDDMSRSFLED